MLNPRKGHMYEFITHTWNPVKGSCSHKCCYCYMERFPPFNRPVKFVEEEFTNLGKGRNIFVGSSIDLFAATIPGDWIVKILDKCNNHNNKYLFQSKNVKRMLDYDLQFPPNSTIGTTIETNRDYPLSDAPKVEERASWLRVLGEHFETMVTIEPIFDFDLEELISLIKHAKPNLVNIGADTNYRKSYRYPEPSKKKIRDLIIALGQFTEVRIKHNLERLFPEITNTTLNHVKPAKKNGGEDDVRSGIFRYSQN